jgi:hypothetical protein
MRAYPFYRLAGLSTERENMKKILVVISALMVFALPVSAQYARRIVPGPALPANCLPGNGEVFFLTVGNIGFYQCTATNTWKPGGITNNGLNFAQGTLVASTPFISHTATWNNGAVVFSNFVSNITNTGSNASSLLFDLQVNSATVFNITVGGRASGFAFRAEPTGSFQFGTTRSQILSSADSALRMMNAAGTDFGALTWGPEAVTQPQIARSAAVGGQTQGIIILRGDGTVQTQANLGAATNGSMIYCNDCTVANPCAGGGTGAIAKRLNGAWVCN